MPHSKANITHCCFCGQPNLLIYPLLKNTFEKGPELFDTDVGPDTHCLVQGPPLSILRDPKRLWQEERSGVVMSGHVLQVPVPWYWHPNKSSTPSRQSSRKRAQPLTAFAAHLCLDFTLPSCSVCHYRSALLHEIYSLIPLRLSSLGLKKLALDWLKD